MNTVIRHLVSSVLLMFSSIVFAAPAVNTLEAGLFGTRPSGIAIRGYDTVAYFTEGKALKGDSGIQTNWNGATWFFSSSAHREMFLSDPERFAPQFGGYCAYGVAMGGLYKVEGDQWSIIDGKLYLSYDEEWRRKWIHDATAKLAEAATNYATLLAK